MKDILDEAIYDYTEENKLKRLKKFLISVIILGLMGVIFLFICSIRGQKGHFFGEDKNGHLGFSFASWYWHFVDLVWILLFIFMYIFGS